MKTFLRAVPFLAIAITILVIVYGSGSVAIGWSWWQQNIVDTAYRGPSDFHATEWWALPALVISFFIPLIPLVAVVGGMVSIFLITYPDEK